MANHLQRSSRRHSATSIIMTLLLSLSILTSPSLSAALPVTLPSLLHRQVEPVQGCANTQIWVYGGSVQTSQSDCTAAATQLCALIPSEGWNIDDWTHADSGSCRAMVFHNDNMPVPTEDDCLQTFGAIIPACIVQTAGKPDGGWANVNTDTAPDTSDVWSDSTKTVYQIGATGYFDKQTQMNNAKITAAYLSEGGAVNHA